jgi:hypothetical protein
MAVLRDHLFRWQDKTTDQGEWPRCDYCGLPAVCYGADLALPKHRCPRCCRANPQFGGRMTPFGGDPAFHGRDDYLDGHAAAEGVGI